MKNFIEVSRTEEEQAEQIKKWVKNNVPQIIIGVAVGFLGIWGFNYYQNQQQQASIQARALYLSIVANPNNTSAYDALTEKYTDSIYVQHAELMLAKQAVKKEDYQAAIAYLSPLTSSEHNFISHNAKMRIASVYLQLNDTDKALAILNGNTNTAFDAMYSDIKGDVYVAKGDIEAAKIQYQSALKQLSKDSKLINLIQIKLDDLK